MNFLRAIASLQEGAWLRRVKWEKEEFYNTVYEEGFIVGFPGVQDMVVMAPWMEMNKKYDPSLEDICADDWKTYTREELYMLWQLEDEDRTSLNNVMAQGIAA